MAALALGTLLAIFAVYLVYAAFPGRSTSLPIKNGFGRTVDKLLPQGWAFYTADPSAIVYLPYRLGGPVGDEWVPASAGPLAGAANAFGFDRSPRLQDQQVQSIVAGTSTDDWQACSSGLTLASVAFCLEDDPTTVSAVNTWPVPVLCGKVAVVAARPIPWSMARRGGPRFTATATLIADLRC